MEDEKEGQERLDLSLENVGGHLSTGRDNFLNTFPYPFGRNTEFNVEPKGVKIFDRKVPWDFFPRRSLDH